MSLDDVDKYIVKYIYENPCCKYSTLVKALAHSYENNSYIRKKMNRKTLKKRIDGLLTLSILISHGTRKDKGREDLVDVFTINDDKIGVYPELFLKETKRLGKEIFEMIEKGMKLKWINYGVSAALNHSEVHVKQREKSTKFYLSDDKYLDLKEWLIAVIFRFFLANSETWWAYQKPEDFDFSIAIKTNFSKSPEFIELSKQFIKDNSTNENRLLFYTKAKFEEEKRKRERKETSCTECKKDYNPTCKGKDCPYLKLLKLKLNYSKVLFMNKYNETT